MSRIYVLQSPRIAAAAARMKADVNFLGVVDATRAQWLKENHVFLRDVWHWGELTVRRLQRLHHRLFPGDLLFMDGSLAEPLIVKAAAYARERRTSVIICIAEGEVASPEICRQADFLVTRGGTLQGEPGTLISLDTGENMEAWAGAMALCLMNGLSVERLHPFCKRAAAFAELPWYDEIAYG
jgi:hypothetical protein